MSGSDWPAVGARLPKITGIPQFMVFDKKGNIVSVDVPRPSSPELKKMLENEESRLKQIT